MAGWQDDRAGQLENVVGPVTLTVGCGSSTEVLDGRQSPWPAGTLAWSHEQRAASSEADRRRVGGAKVRGCSGGRARARVPLGKVGGITGGLTQSYGVMLHAPCAPSLPETQLAPVVRARVL